MSSPLFDGLGPTAANDAANDRIVRVALPVPLDRLFDYRLPRGQTAPVLPGTRVRVDFAGQPLIGLVVPGDWQTEEDEELGSTAAERSLVAIKAVVDEEPVVSLAMMQLLAEAAREIFSPIGQALGHALPPGSTPRLARPWALTARGERALSQGALSETALGGAARPLLESLAEKAQTAHALAKALPRIDLTRSLDALAADGLVERRVEVRAAKARIPMERVVRLAKDIDPVFAATKTLARAPRQAALLRRIAEFREGVPTRRLTEADAKAGPHLRTLAARGLVVVSERPRLTSADSILDGGGEVELTEDQRDALVPLRDAIKRQVAETFLLHGVTGSGKTEVYLRAIAEALEAGRQALVLVPEITLTHQILARVRSRFGDEVAVLHSGLKPGERLAQWERLRTGQTAIAVGARSALFAPLESLGLIVIDEEHDGAYKNDEGFRYHAIDIATRRAQAAGCPLILGSATPSLETRHRADSGALKRLSLPRRVGGRPLPAVEIVDLGKERDKNPRGRKLILSRPMRNAIEQTIGDGGQTILFLNRRGFSTRIFCFQCGHAERCDDCDVALVFHAADHQLRCHYCDLVRDPPEVCNGCGDPETALLGVGTERLEEEVHSLFPDARTMRLDRDVAAKRGHTEQVLMALKNEDVDIVIGTQMVAKGHDFPGVQMVGVVAADIGLHLPDFRAAERTFQLLTQVAGRAGRADRPGRVVVQTFVPGHYALAPVGSHDFEGFYREEIEHREALGYPPFGRLTRIVVHAEDEGLARQSIEQVSKAVRAALAEGATNAEPTANASEASAASQETNPTGSSEGKVQPEKSLNTQNAGVPAIEVLGPSPAPIAKLRGRYRFMCLLKGDDSALLRIASKAALRVGRRLGRDVQMALDARPVNML